MKALLIIASLLVITYTQNIAFAGTWQVTFSDQDCATKCCCPQGNVIISPHPTNSSAVFWVASSWGNNTVCSALGRKPVSTPILPYPAVIDLQKTPLNGLYNPQGEEFGAYFFNTTSSGAATIGVDLVIDDIQITNNWGSICVVALVKK